MKDALELSDVPTVLGHAQLNFSIGKDFFSLIISLEGFRRFKATGGFYNLFCTLMKNKPYPNLNF